jgi:ribonuclease-3
VSASEDTRERLEAAERALGVAFADRSLLKTALTHPSWATEHHDSEEYERLEFLGDSLVGFVVAEHLYRTLADEPEGILARLRAEIVSGASLARCATAAGIDQAIFLGRGAEAGGGRHLESVLGDVMEAVIGAVYLDQGLAVAREATLRLIVADALPDALSGTTRDPKGVLQEHTMATDGSLPEYRVVSEEGPPHVRVFTVEVLVAGEVAGRGMAGSKKAAEKAAAAEAVDTLGIVPRA